MTDMERVARAIVRAGATQIGREDIDCHWPKGWEDLRKGALKQATAAIAEHIAALADVGLVIVPREPNGAMERAGFTEGDRDPWASHLVWKSMIAAYTEEP